MGEYDQPERSFPFSVKFLVHTVAAGLEAYFEQRQMLSGRDNPRHINEMLEKKRYGVTGMMQQYLDLIGQPGDPSAAGALKPIRDQAEVEFAVLSGRQQVILPEDWTFAGILRGWGPAGLEYALRVLLTTPEGLARIRTEILDETWEGR